MSLLEQYEEWKKKKQAEVQQAQQPKYTIPSTGSIAEKYEAYRKQRQAEEQAAVSSKRINNPSHLGNVMTYSAVQNTQRKQAESARVAKEDETRRVKREDTRLHLDTVNRLTQQYMPVRPDPIPQVDINKKYGPSSSRSAMVASAGVSDAPFNGMSEAERDRREREEREERDRADREAYQAALERANLGRGGKLNESSGRGGDLSLPSTGRGGALGNNPANGWDYDAQKAQDIRRVEQEDELANKYQLPSDGRKAETQITPQVETVGQTIEELTARRAEVQKDLETYDTVLKWPVGRQDVEGQQNFANAQAQRPQAQKELDSLNEQIRLKEKEQRSAEDTSKVEALKAKYEAAPDWQKGEALAELKAAEYNRDWNAMTPLEQTGVWLGDRAKRALYTINDAVYAIPDLIADVAGIDRLQWSKNNKAALGAVQQNIEQQAKKTGWLINSAGDVVSEGIRMIPTILIASMTGGASLAAQGAANIATAGAGTGAKIAQATVDMLKNPKFVNSFFTMFGLNLSRAREAGIDPATAVSMSWQKALPSALIEMSGGYEKAAERGRGWMDWLIGSLEEGREEVVQGITDTAVEKTFGNVFSLSVDDVISLTDQEAIVSGARAAEEFGLGAVTAGVMGGAQIGLLKGVDAITGNDPRRSETFPSDGSIELNKKIAENEAKMAALETAARERSETESRDSEARKQYNELVQVVNSALPAESATRALITEEGPVDTERMEAVAKGALSEYSELLKANPSDEMAGKAQALNKAIEALYTGIKADRDTTVDKYTAGLDEAVKSEIKGKTGEEAVTYAKGYGIAHALGQMGVSNDTIAKATGFEDAQKAAEEGRAKWDIELPKAKNKAAELRKALPLPGKGSVTYHSNVKQDALTTGQRDQISLLEQVAKPMGYKFVMVEFEKDAAGNYVTDKGQIAPNGYFRDTDGTIYIDVNAGKTAGRMVEDTIIPQTAGHELTHYLKANSPELFRAYSAAVIDELIAKGQDINTLITQKLGRAKLSSIGVEAALEEVIADSSAMMLQNTQAVQALAKTNPSLFQKITEWVKDFIERVRKAFSKVEGTPEAKALMSMRDGVMKYADSLQQMWDDMAASVAQAKLDEKPVTVARRDVPAKPENPVNERINTAYTSDGQAVDYHYEIAPVGSLIPSNLETSLEPNPDYPQELQPRDRTRAASQQQVEEIANKLNPALLGESADVGTGAPFVGPDMVVESGNGRILAITRAMRHGKGLTYTQWLKDNASRFGIDPAKVDNASVLVRVRDTEVNRPEFVQKANESQVATYSDSESAVSDAKKVTPAMLEMANMDSGDINSAGNSGFVASFISKVVPVAERGRMMDASGKLSKSGENRVRTALFQMAYEDGYLTEQMAEASDDTSKNILKAMTAVAPRLALMNDAMKKGTLSDYPIGQAIAEAYRVVQRQKRLGVSVDRYINQQSLVRQDTPAHWMLLEMFNENRNAPSRMTDALNSILNAAERQGNPNQMLMPGLEAERPSVEGIVRDGLNRYADEGMAASERDTLKFQMRTPVEETAKLIAVHNLNESKLSASIKSGGFPMPSIALIKEGQGHDWYGDISVLFGRETIDPQTDKRNAVYSSDAWTPVHPGLPEEWNLDQIVDIMLEEQLESNVPEVIDAVEQYTSVDEIKNKSSRLGRVDNYDEIKENLSKKLNDVVAAFDKSKSPFRKRSRKFYITESLRGLLQTGATTVDQIQREMASYDSKKIPIDGSRENAQKFYDLLQEIYNIPTGYFEAKPRRVVSTNEIRAVVLPDNANDDIKNSLKNAGVPFVEYKAGDSKSRLAALNSPGLDGVKFQEREYALPEGTVARDERNNRYYVAIPANVPDPMWEDMLKGFQRLGYGTRNITDLKEFVGRYVERKQGIANDDQSDLIAKLAGIKVAKYSADPQVAEARRLAAVKEFGYTPYFYDAGYILPNGKLLNFSGDKGKHYGSRGQDHRAIGIVFEEEMDSDSARMVAFVGEGNIRIMDETPGIDISVNAPPTLQQRKTIKEHVQASTQRQYYAVDFTNDKGYSAGQYEYEEGATSSRVLSDIDYFFKNGEVRELSDVAKFHFQERDSDNASLSPEQIEYFKDSKVRDEQGRLLKVYHGTTRGFTEFRTNAPGQTIKDTIGSHFGTEKAANDRLGVVGKEKSPYGENVPSVMDVFLNITNPLLKRDGSAMTESELNAYLKRVGKKLNIPDRELGSSSQFSRVPSYVGETIQAYLKEQGYDGIPYINSWEDRGNVSYIAFSPEQIKSTTNLTPTSSPDIRYQERDPDYRTKRDILAGAFDSVAQTEGEKRNLKEYKNLIGSLNRMEEEARGLRQANTAERKKPGRDKTVIESNTKRIAEIEERINNLDKRLLKMQNAAPLQNVLKREVDYYKRQQNALNKQQLEKYRADRAETSMRQRYRNDISKGVKTLNNTLMNESDQKHIPEGFKAAVIEFLKLFTDNTSVFDYKRLSILKEMYDALETSDSELAGMYDFDVAQDIADAARMLEGKRLSQLTEAELESLRDIVAHFNHIVKNENQIFTQKRSVKTTDAAEEGLSEYGKKAKAMRLALLNGKNPIAAINKFLTSKNIKPMYFFKRVGGILQELFDDIRAAQGKWAFRMNEDRIFFRDTVNKYNYYKWADDGQLTFATARGDQITLTRDQALELYAINKREKTNKQQGAEHLAVGGFVYEDAVKVKKKSALGVPMTYEIDVGENHPLTDSDLEQIGKWLTNEQRAFADEMVNYLSTVMGERGNEVSLAMYGIRKYVEKYYFPYKSANNYLHSHQGGAQDDSAIKHRSFTKRTTASANNPVVLTGFTKVWADHVQNMNLYNAMAVPLDNFNRVYNYRIRGDKDATKAQSVKAALEAAYGKEANAYIKQLLNDVNGGIRPDKGDAEARKLMSLWKKGAVFASLSVVVQQPSAIGRALALVDAKYFRKGYTKAGYEEMMKWSGTANIKAMGRFDANMGMTAAGWLAQREYTGMDEKAKAFAKDGSFRDDVLSWLPQKADEMTWTALWEAVKRETASRHGNLIGTDAFMQKVAERFDEVVDYTQVYDSVLSRSEVMRSQSALAQMVTSFMAEPTTAYNMLMDAMANRKNKGMKNYVKPGRALGAFAVSVLLNSILKAMVTAGRDDDEKYTYLEKYLRKVSGSIADELNPLGLVPYGRDILSLWEGYDIERADMSLIGDLINAAKKASKTDAPILQRMDVLAGAIGNALGIPYKNVRRDIQGVYNVLANTAPMSRQSASGAKYSILEGLPWFDSSRAGYARKLYSAIVKGDAQEEAGLREQISKIVKKDSDINTELRKIITTEFEEERLEPRTALQQMIDLTALKEVKGKIGDWYKDGLIGQDVSEQLLVEFTQDDQPNERYKTIEGWNFSKDPDNEGESYSTYKPFYDAIDSGKDLRAVVNTYMDPKKYGASKSTLSGRITDNYKEQYIEAYKRSRTEAAALKARLLNAYALLGYDRDKKSKDIDAWLK